MAAPCRYVADANNPAVIRKLGKGLSPDVLIQYRA
jgi:hypothetical protein